MRNIARLLVLIAFGGTGAALAQDYPNRPVKVIVPWPPGQATDIAARMVSEKLAPVLGQALVIDNRPGAGGVIGTDAASKSTPDGYSRSTTRKVVGCKDSDFKHPTLSIGGCRTPVKRAFCMVERPKIPLLGGALGCRGQP